MKGGPARVPRERSEGAGLPSNRGGADLGVGDDAHNPKGPTAIPAREYDRWDGRVTPIA